MTAGNGRRPRRVDEVPLYLRRAQARRDLHRFQARPQNPLEQLIAESLRRAVDAGDTQAERVYEGRPAQLVKEPAWLAMSIEAMVDAGLPLTAEQQARYDARQERLERWARSPRARALRIRYELVDRLRRARRRLALAIDPGLTPEDCY